MTPFYAEPFPGTEVNYSFRQVPSEKTLAAWDAATPAELRLSFKAPQKSTRFAKLQKLRRSRRLFFKARSRALG